MVNFLVIIAILIATVIPIGALFVIYRFDFYRTGQFKAIAISMLVGLVAYWVAASVNGYVISRGILPAESVIRYTAPILEETLKGFILLYLVRRANFSFFVEGAIYGFAIGIGFAVVENYAYILGNPDAGLATAITRVLSTNLMHAAATSCLGLILGITRFENGWMRPFAQGLGGLAIAMLIHTGYNNLVTQLEGSLFLLIYAIASGVGGAALILLLIKQGLETGRKQINQSLGMGDRVTRREVEVITRMESIDDILEPLAAQFGEEKAQQIKNFLVKQARMGLMRNSLAKLDNEKDRQAKEQEIEKLRIEMDNARKQVGSYGMLYLRSLFPQNESPVWGKLESALQERMSTARPASGLNLWAILKARQEERKKQTEANIDIATGE